MTTKILLKILELVPADTKIESDSGWECDPTLVGMVVFSETAKVLIMRQTESASCENVRKTLKYYDDRYSVTDFQLLYNGE